MDFSMFDDESEDVGQEIEAYCARCKADTPSTSWLKAGRKRALSLGRSLRAPT